MENGLALKVSGSEAGRENRTTRRRRHHTRSKFWSEFSPRPIAPPIRDRLPGRFYTRQGKRLLAIQMNALGASAAPPPLECCRAVPVSGNRAKHQTAGAIPDSTTADTTCEDVLRRME